MKTNGYLSGDQNILWDAGFKLRVAARLGLHVNHSVHTADLFSRHPQGADKPLLVTREAYRPDGNVTRWTASLEAAEFLGMMPLHPTEFTSRRVDFKQVALMTGKGLGEVVAAATEGDWHGISVRSDGLMAHGMPMQTVLPAIPKWRKLLRNNLKESTDGPFSKEAMNSFDRLFNITRTDYHKLTWDAAMQRHLSEMMEGQEGVMVSTTVDEFAGNGTWSRFFPFFVQNYSACFDAYNQAVAGSGGEQINPLKSGELPFYAVVQNGRGLKRVDLQMNGSQEGILRDLRSEYGEVIAIIGKAIPHMVELRMYGPLLMPESGSAYTPLSLQFLQALPGASLDVHPIYRLKLHALDALQDIEAGIRFRLPEYLRGYFGGQEWIEARDFGHNWCEAVKAAKQDADRLSGDLMDVAGATGVNDATLGQLMTLMKEKEQFNRDCRVLFERAKADGESLPKRERVALMQRTGLLRQELFDTNDRDIRDAQLRMLLAGIEARRVKKLRTALAASKLGYWNWRPFYHWTFGVPGWREAIYNRAELVCQS